MSKSVAATATAVAIAVKASECAVIRVSKCTDMWHCQVVYL